MLNQWVCCFRDDGDASTQANSPGRSGRGCTRPFLLLSLDLSSCWLENFLVPVVSLSFSLSLSDLSHSLSQIMDRLWSGEMLPKELELRALRGWVSVLDHLLERMEDFALDCVEEETQVRGCSQERSWFLLSCGIRLCGPCFFVSQL